MKNLKVVIIGAGICGLYLAEKLSEIGYKVTVFEKKQKIGKEVCSGLFSERILKFIPQSEHLIKNRIHSVLIHFPRKTVKISFSKTFFVINHFELDNLVAKLVEKFGTKIILNHPLDSIPEGFDRIIGCDGATSIVRRRLGLPEPNYRLALQGFISQKNYSDFVETWPINRGFIWKIPRGEKTEYGAIGNSNQVKLIFEKFLKENNLKLKEIKSALVPQGLIIPSHSKITLCGDAAGLTKPWSGGGVIWGLLAANILLKNFPDFLKYQKEIKSFFILRIIFSKFLTKMVYFFGFKLPWLLPKNVKIEGDFLI